MKTGVKKKAAAKADKEPTRGVKSRSTTSEDGASEPGAKPKGSGARWTFLTNHSHVLIVLSAEPDLVLREVAARVGITERAVQRVVQDLEEGGFIRRERVGRQNRYEVVKDVPLRHPIEEHRNIGDLLNLITG